jgi:hypothetical protein
MGKFYKFILSLFLLAGASAVSLAQSAAGNMDIPPEFRFRINSIESFIKRFNYEEDENGNYRETNKSALGFVKKRNGSLLSLFKLDKLEQADTSEAKKIFQFLNAINTDSQQVKLDFYDKDWFAEVKLEIMYKHVPEEVTLILVNKQKKPKVSSWIISGVKAPFLQVKKRPGDDESIIPPNSHGTDFIGLPQSCARQGFVRNNTLENFEADVMSIFLYAVENKEIEFKTVKNVSYHFLQIKDWIIRVEEVARDNYNSGWLIQELIKINEGNKNVYVSQKLNIYTNE